MARRNIPPEATMKNSIGIDIATFRRLRPVVQNARVTSILVENGRLFEAPGEALD